MGWKEYKQPDSMKFRTRSVEKQGGMAFGLWNTATAFIKLDR
jgi:hypothetical protein